MADLSSEVKQDSNLPVFVFSLWHSAATVRFLMVELMQRYRQLYVMHWIT
jgi:hypothetical protein